MRPEPGSSSPAPGLSTRAVHAGEPEPRAGEPVVSPVVPASTFFTDAAPQGEVLYTRYGTNPNHTAVAAKMAALEGAESALVVGSGMAAITLSLLSVLRSGDHLVAQRELYGGTHTLLMQELPRLGIEVGFVGQDEDWETAVRPTTRALLAEIPINPTLRVPDVRRLAGLAASSGLPLLVDATFATPVNFRPLEHGATLSIHSATKYLGGHSDVTAGVVAGPAELIETVRIRMKSYGAVLDPHATWLLERGIKTLDVRMMRHNQNALALAGWLEAHPAVAAVHHPGLASHPDHARAAELFDGFGGMLGVVVRGGDDAALRVLNRFRLIRAAPSLGGVESLASMPLYTSHAAFSDAERRALGIDAGFLRISVGIEDVADLRADMEAALAGEAA